MKLFKEIEKNFPLMEKLFKNEDIKKFLRHEYSDLFLYHFGFGTWIRNNMLDEQSKLYKMFISVNVKQKDEMSSLIINLFYISPYHI